MRDSPTPQGIAIPLSSFAKVVVVLYIQKSGTHRTSSLLSNLVEPRLLPKTDHESPVDTVSVD